MSTRILSDDDGVYFVNDAGETISDAEGLRSIRDEMNWSVRDLARICCVSPRTIEGWEQGRTAQLPALKLLQILQQALI